MKEEEFRERVKKTFGNLLTTITPKPTPSSLSDPLWSLTAGHVERRQWRRDHVSDDRDNNPCASSFDDFVSCARKNSRKNLGNYSREFEHHDDDNHDDVDEKLGGLDDWDLKGSIGLDSTLDHEDEEDAFDKVAIGRENTGDRLYMGVVANKKVPNFVLPDDLSSSTGKMKRDPRANRMAAEIRLKEDDAEAGLHETAHAPPANAAEKVSAPSSGDGVNVKPILKRKERESTSKPSKRVTFDPECVNEGSSISRASEITSANIPLDDSASINQPLFDERVSQVPDYVRNPSKYTRYTLDSTDETSDKSSAQNSVSRFDQDDPSTDLPKSITFVPKKKSDSAKADAAHFESTTLLASFVDESIEDAEADDIEVGMSKKHERHQYRTKSQADEPE